MTKINLLQNAAHLTGTPTEEPPLTPEMQDIDPALAKVFETKVDLLRSYLVLAENPADLADANQRRVIFAKLSYGLRKSGEYLSWARFHHRMALMDVKRAEAGAAIDGIHQFIEGERTKGRDGKITDKVRDHYKFIDKSVGSNMLREAMLEAMVEQLKTMKTEFIMSIATLKAMAYGVDDTDHMSSAASAPD